MPFTPIRDVAATVPDVKVPVEERTNWLIEQLKRDDLVLPPSPLKLSHDVIANDSKIPYDVLAASAARMLKGEHHKETPERIVDLAIGNYVAENTNWRGVTNTMQSSQLDGKSDIALALLGTAVEKQIKIIATKVNENGTLPSASELRGARR